MTEADARVDSAVGRGARARAATRRRDPFDELWAFFASPRLALFLIFAIVLASFAGALVIQAPGEVVSNPKAQASWIAQVRPRFGPLTDLFQTLQIFWVFQTLWFRALLGLLAINIVVCTANRLPGIWQAVFHPTTRPSEGLFDRGRPRETVLLRGASLADGVQAARAALRGHRTVESVEAEGVYFYADRNRLARFGTIATHLALLLVFAGVVGSGFFGYFEESTFAVPIGSTREVGHDTGLAVHVDDFVDEYYPENGAPKDYRTEMVLLENGQEVARGTVRVNEPLIYKGIRFHQSFFGPAATVSVASQSGQIVFEDAVPFVLRSNDGNRPVGYFYLPGRDLYVYLIGTAGQGDPRIQPGQLVVEAYRGLASTPAYTATLMQGQPASVGDLTFTFNRELQFTGLRVVRDPAVPVIWFASALLVLGLVVTFYFPHRRLWARVRSEPAGAQVTLVGAGREMAEHLQHVASRLESRAGGAAVRVRHAAPESAGPEAEQDRAVEPRPRSTRAVRRAAAPGKPAPNGRAYRRAPARESEPAAAARRGS